MDFSDKYPIPDEYEKNTTAVLPGSKVYEDDSAFDHGQEMLQDRYNHEQDIVQDEHEKKLINDSIEYRKARHIQLYGYLEKVTIFVIIQIVFIMESTLLFTMNLGFILVIGIIIPIEIICLGFGWWVLLRIDPWTIQRGNYGRGGLKRMYR